MDHKTFELVEAKTEDDTGSFQALAAVFGNVDRGGDRMMPGAFKGTLEKWRASGRPIPIIYSHQHDDLHAYIGKADPRAVYEDERGLVVQGQLDMEDEKARKAHRLMKDGLITGWSFGYTVPKGGQEVDEKGVNEISEVELFEVGPTLVGMNAEAQLEAIKTWTVNEVRAKENLPPVEGGDIPMPATDENLKRVHMTAATEDAPASEPIEAQAQASHPLRTAHDRLVYELMTGKPPSKAKAEGSSLAELRRAHDALMLDILIGK